MTLTINDTTITSDRNPHTARQAPGRPHQCEVSWLPGQLPDRNTAITAIILADIAASGDLPAGHWHWPDIQSWGAELRGGAGNRGQAMTLPEAFEAAELAEAEVYYPNQIGRLMYKAGRRDARRSWPLSGPGSPRRPAARISMRSRPGAGDQAAAPTSLTRARATSRAGPRRPEKTRSKNWRHVNERT
jgi:hypothetical protein